ncbi:acetyl-CoA synthetase, partial [Lobosporangium transversale]
MADIPDGELYPVPQRLLDPAQCPEPYISSLQQYKELYQQSIEQPDEFFGKLATDLLTWSKPFNRVRHGGFKYGDVAWFLDGRINASYNCVDRHAIENPKK